MNEIEPQTEAPVSNGKLAVTANFGSHFLSQELPFHVVDTDLGIVAHGKSGGQVSLPPGVYAIEMPLPSGIMGRKIATVSSEERVEVSFTHESHERPGSPDLFSDVTTDVVLAKVVGANVAGRGVSENEQFWVFEPEEPLHEVPTARFMIQGATVDVSLPVNPNGLFPLTSCRVKSISEGGRRTIQASFGEGRAVSQVIEGLVRSKGYAHSSGLLFKATELLRDKYSDPSGAALGGLTLLRLGHAGPRWQWVHNLAHEAPWLPDAQFLYAALLLNDANPIERRRGFELLAANSGGRPMYSDGLSLALELLRGWGRDHDEDKLEVRHAVQALSQYSAYADWSRFCLTTWIR